MTADQKINPPGPGHNNPPSNAELLAEVLEALPDTLAEAHEKLTKRAKDLHDAATRMPTEITEQEDADKATNFITLIQACRTLTEKTRKEAKDPFLKAGKEVDAFFKPVHDGLEGLQRTVTKPLDGYNKKKRDAEAEAFRAAQEKAQKESEKRLEEAAALEAQGNTEAAEKKLESATKMETRADKLGAIASSGAGIGSYRTETGALSGLVKRWVGVWVDSNAILTEREPATFMALWKYVPEAAKQTALNGLVREYAEAMKTNPDMKMTTIPGAKIEEVEETRVRR